MTAAHLLGLPAPDDGGQSPKPVAPTDEALLECAAKALGYYHIPQAETCLTATADELLVFARAALARWGRPAIQPVAVSDRLPGPEDCDLEGRCWLCGKVEGDWRLIEPANSGVPQLKYCFSHWLPANALPLPQADGI
jgi:hypothetical protein